MGRLTAIVLGAAAGGGYPQWNCNCPVCRLAWSGDRRVRPRSQTSLAVHLGERGWLLVNASPDLRTQIMRNPVLQPKRDGRDSPIVAVLLTGAEIDQAAGLLHLRERQAFTLFATPATLLALRDNPMFDALSPEFVERRAAQPGEAFNVGEVSVEVFSVPGKVPLFLERGEPAIEETDANVGVEFTQDGRHLVFMPGAATITPAMRERLQRADVILFDGTLFTDDEMIVSGTGHKTARRMGHMPIDGVDGSLAVLAGLPGRRIYIHVNNTNPILVEGSPERRCVEEAGFEIAEDGMEILL
jgi:pyrroloquinoline quinone biosynthesis protein B